MAAHTNNAIFLTVQNDVMSNTHNYVINGIKFDAIKSGEKTYLVDGRYNFNSIEVGDKILLSSYVEGEKMELLVTYKEELARTTVLSIVKFSSINPN